MIVLSYSIHSRDPNIVSRKHRDSSKSLISLRKCRSEFDGWDPIIRISFTKKSRGAWMIFNSGAIRSVPRLTRRFLHHAVVLEKIGGIFSDQKLQSPSLTGDRQVRVQVDSCGVAYRDTLDREGAFPFISLPAVLGHEISGTVIEVSPGTDLAVGDKVVSVHWDQDEAWPSPLTTTGPVSSFLGLTLHGGYQELMVIPETALVKLESSIACRWTAAEAAV